MRDKIAADGFVISCSERERREAGESNHRNRKRRRTLEGQGGFERDLYMRTKIYQWGNSLALRIPRAFALKAGLYKGAVVDVLKEGGKITLTPVKKSRLTLEGLLAGVTKDNIHREISTGRRVDKEIW